MGALGGLASNGHVAPPAESDAACHDEPAGAEAATVSTAIAAPPEQPLATDPIEFASLLCSRLCHDLLSPVGAINNGLELLADERDPEMRARCLDLLAESARASANKLKFFRLAFGAAGGFGETVDPREARSAVEGLFGDAGRIQLGWMLDEQPLPKPALKVLLNLVLIAGDALIRGGRLDIGAEARGTTMEIVVRAEGGRLVLDEELRGALLGTAGDTPVTPRAAAAFLVRALVASSSGELQVSGPADGVLVLGATMGVA
jgi:histidine phosphotransferase ChpT